MNAFDVVRDFEKALCEYTGAKYACATTSCTEALLVACAYLRVGEVSIPRLTYRGVAMSILNAGGKVLFDDRQWRGSYTLDPYNIKDSARRFTSGMYVPGYYECVSFHCDKILGHTQGGAILHDNGSAQHMFQQMCRDGAYPSTPLHLQTLVRGFHCAMWPDTAAALLRRLMTLPKHNEDLPNSDYSDLSHQSLFGEAPEEWAFLPKGETPYAKPKTEAQLGFDSAELLPSNPYEPYP